MKSKAIGIVLTLQLVFFANVSHGQTKPFNKLAFKANYYGEFILHPGFSLGTDMTLIDNRVLDIHWDTEIGSYFHKRNNNALFIQSTIGSRFTADFGGFVDLNAGIGYMLSTPNGETFIVAEDGNTTKDGRPYTSHFKPSFSLLIGWDFTKNTELPILINTGIEPYWQSHYNHSFLPHVALKLGIVYKLQNNK